MTTQLEIIQPETIQPEVVQAEEVVALDKVLSESGLEKTETTEAKENYLPFLSELHGLKEQSVKIDFNNPSELDEKIAREIRLKVVKIRTGAEGLKDKRKKIHLLKGNVEQAAYNLIKANCELFEANLAAVENVRKLAEEARKKELAATRLTELQQYGFVQNNGFNLADMDDAMYQTLLVGTKKTFEDRIAAEKKAEEERIEKERIDNLHKERKESILSLWNFVNEKDRDINFGELGEEQWNGVVAYAENNKSEHDAEQKRIADENARLKAEKEEADRVAAEKGKLRDQRLQLLKVYRYVHETDVAELSGSDFTKLLTDVKSEHEKKVEEGRKVLEAQMAKAEQERKEREAAELKAKQEREAREKAEKELQAKKDAEAKAEADRLAAAELEAAKGEAERFIDFMNELQGLITKYSFKSKKYKALFSSAVDLINKTLNFLTGKL